MLISFLIKLTFWFVSIFLFTFKTVARLKHLTAFITNETLAPSCGQPIKLQIQANRGSNTFALHGFRTSVHVTTEGQSWRPVPGGSTNIYFP